MTITWLDAPDCHDPRRVGGKAAHLGQLAASHPVPPGFCLAAPSGDAGGASRLWNEIAEAYAHLGRRCRQADPPVAVRSSAVDEDGAQTSFAGLHDTYLNVVGPDAVAQAVHRCVASAHTPRAQYYRRAHGLAATTQVAVLVQQLVIADVSAVVFSADPRTGETGDVLINTTWGLGESLVSGSVIPDFYVVRKADLTIQERRLGDKQVMTVMRSSGQMGQVPSQTPAGTQEVPVPTCMRREACLNDHQIRALARLAIDLHTKQGWPVDLECAYEQGKLYLLQCRPITTMNRTPSTTRYDTSARRPQRSTS